jgi:hypothetical protein
MKTELPVQELVWSQPQALWMAYELHQANTMIATLEFRSVTGTMALGTSQEGAWTFKRVGCFKPRITIRQKEHFENIAIFTNQTWKHGGSLILADGRTFNLSSNFWQTTLEIQTSSGLPLVRFLNDGFIRIRSHVSVFNPAADMNELPWLMMLGWYVAVLSYMDTASASSFISMGAAFV